MFHQVLRNIVGRAYDNLVNELTGEDRQHSFVKVHNGIVIALIPMISSVFQVSSNVASVSSDRNV